MVEEGHGETPGTSPQTSDEMIRGDTTRVREYMKTQGLLLRSFRAWRRPFGWVSTLHCARNRLSSPPVPDRTQRSTTEGPQKDNRLCVPRFLREQCLGYVVDQKREHARGAILRASKNRQGPESEWCALYPEECPVR